MLSCFFLLVMIDIHTSTFRYPRESVDPVLNYKYCYINFKNWIPDQVRDDDTTLTTTTTP